MIDAVKSLFETTRIYRDDAGIIPGRPWVVGMTTLTRRGLRAQIRAMDEREPIPPADPDQAFKIANDRALDQLEATVANFPLTDTQLQRVRLLCDCPAP